MKGSRVTLGLAGLTGLVLILSVPAALREAYERGGLYLFSWAFLADIPKRLAGPGRFRFVMQPAVAILLGVRDGRQDARAGRPPYLLGLLVGGPDRREQLLGVSHPGVALVVGPVLITAPYGLARALANRAARANRSPVRL